MGLKSFLNGGLYNNTCQKLNLFAKNAMVSLKRGVLKKESFAQMNVGIKHTKNFLQEDGKIQKFLNVKNVEKNLGYKNIELKLVEENIVQENVMEKQNLKRLKEKIIPNILMEELKDIQFVKNVKRRLEDYVPTIKYQSEYAKIPWANQILLPYAIPVIKKNIRGENGII